LKSIETALHLFLFAHDSSCLSQQNSSLQFVFECLPMLLDPSCQVKQIGSGQHHCLFAIPGKEAIASLFVSCYFDLWLIPLGARLTQIHPTNET
jgi:hypothetical protein